MNEIEEIINSHINGQFKQMKNQIDEYGPYSFFPTLADQIGELITKDDFIQITTAYNNSKNYER